MLPQVQLSRKYGWRTQVRDTYTLHLKGELDCVEAIYALLRQENNQLDEIKTLLLKQVNPFSCVIESKDWVFAVVDRIRAYPIFYGFSSDTGVVSNCARTAQRAGNAIQLNQTSLLEFCMAGYVSGSETLYKGLNQLQAGEFLLWCRNDERAQLQRYYLYITTH